MREWIINTAFTGYEFLLPIYGFAFTFMILVLIPLGFIKKIRPVVAIILYIISFIFGATTWLYAVVITFAMLGWIWLVIGLLIAGIGVLPLGLIASLIKGNFYIFFSLLIPFIVTFGSRALALKWGDD